MRSALFGTSRDGAAGRLLECPAADSRRGAAGRLLAGVLAATAFAAPARAQIPGLPLLQSPFAAPQIAVGANLGSADSLRAYGVAGSWTPASARLQLSGGVAGVIHEEGDNGVAGGARVYLPLRSFAGQAVAVGVFVGGGAERAGDATALTLPIGAAVGYRRALGATRALSVYAVPFYSYTRVRAIDQRSNLFRAAFAADAVLAPRVGLSLGYEVGAKAEGSQPGPRSGTAGLGVSYAF